MMFQDYFGDRVETCEILGKTSEPVVFKRAGKGATRTDENNRFAVLLQDGTKVTTGDILTRTDGSVHFVVSRRNNPMASIGQTLRSNTKVALYKVSGSAVTGYSKVLISDSVSAHQKTVNAAMKLFDSGLLDKTVYTFVIPVYDLKLGDRINGFQVDSIDTTSYEGFLYVQVSTDKRVIKSV